MKKQFLYSLSFAGLVMFAAATTPAPANTLVAYYSFDADNGNDSSGNGFHGSLVGSAAFSSTVPSAIGSGKSLTTNTPYPGRIDVASSGQLSSIDHQMTIAYWMKATTASQPAAWGRITQKLASGSGWMTNRNNLTADAKLRVDTATSGGGFNQNRGNFVGVYDNTWHHLAMTLDNGVWRSFVDGGVTGTGTYTHNSGFANGSTWTIGGRTTSDDYVGLLDDVALWNEALGKTDIAQLAAGTPANSIARGATLVAHYDLDENTGVNPIDSTGNTTATIHTSGVGNPTLSTGTPGTTHKQGTGAWRFDEGDPGGITTGNGVIVNGAALAGLGNGTTSNGLSAGFWLNGAGGDAYSRVIDMATDSDIDLLRDGSNTSLRIRVNHPSIDVVIPTVFDNNWHHIAFSVEVDGMFKAYKDGVLVDSRLYTGGAIDTPNQWTLATRGPNGTNRYYDGLLDDVTIFDGVLTNDDTPLGQTAGGQVAQLFTQGGISFVPEPSTLGLAALGMLGLLACGRRRRRESPV